jgi:hypothetical protein
MSSIQAMNFETDSSSKSNCVRGMNGKAQSGLFAFKYSLFTCPAGTLILGMYASAKHGVAQQSESQPFLLL